MFVSLLNSKYNTPNLRYTLIIRLKDVGKREHLKFEVMQYVCVCVYIYIYMYICACKAVHIWIKD
jgi:hypothetical protein